MTRGLLPVPARQAAWSVAGRRDGVAIDALAASGDTQHGRVLLRIGVDRQGGPFGAAEQSVACQEFRFATGSAGASPHAVACLPVRARSSSPRRRP